jgi:uncharacterized protein (DUF427 family)
MDEQKQTMQAMWNDTVIAQSDETMVIEGNHYFPADSVNKEFFTDSDLHTTCPWKGEASYYTVTVDGEVNQDAAWYYPQPKPTAIEAVGDFSNYVAFWHGVEVMPKPAA